MPIKTKRSLEDKENYRYIRGNNNDWYRVSNDDVSRTFESLIVRPDRIGGNKRKYVPIVNNSEDFINFLDKTKSRIIKDDYGNILGEKGLEIVYPEFDILSLGINPLTNNFISKKLSNIYNFVTSYKNPNSLLNKNIRNSIANTKTPIGYNMLDISNYTPFIKGIYNAAKGKEIKLKSLEDVVNRDMKKHKFSKAFTNNAHVAFRKYLGVEDEKMLYSLYDDTPLSVYIPNKDNTFYINLNENDELALLENFSRNKGKGLYDVALGSHGGMNGKLTNNNIFEYEDVLDYQPMKDRKWLPNFIRTFEPSKLIPGAKPFKLKGKINISNYYNPIDYRNRVMKGIGNSINIEDHTGKAYQSLTDEDLLKLILGAGSIGTLGYATANVDTLVNNIDKIIKKLNNHAK